jgi:hypothetical protein
LAKFCPHWTQLVFEGFVGGGNCQENLNFKTMWKNAKISNAAIKLQVLTWDGAFPSPMVFYGENAPARAMSLTPKYAPKLTRINWSTQTLNRAIRAYL